MPRTLNAYSLGGLPIQLDPSARDFASIRARAIELIPKLTDRWTDYSDSDPGIVLIEAMAYIADVLAYHTDKVHNESYLVTAQDRTSVQHLLSLIGYRMSPASPARVSCSVVTDLDNVTIPSGTTLSARSEGVVQTFEIVNDVLIPTAGSYTDEDFPDLVAVHGVTVSENVGTSDGSDNQRYTVGQSPVATESDVAPVVVVVGGVEYTPSGPYQDGSSFVGSNPTDEVFAYSISGDGALTIRFGDGVSGVIPPSGATIAVTYRVGGGSASNDIGVGVLALDSAIDGVVSMTNRLAPSGGSDAESVEHAKRYGPLSLRALDRAITLEDFEVLATRASNSVRASKARIGEHPYEVVLTLIGSGSNPVLTGTWNDETSYGTGTIGVVGSFLRKRCVSPTKLKVRSAVPVLFRLKADVTCLKSATNSYVKSNVSSALTTLFDSVKDDFGLGLPLSAVIQTIENTRGVDFVVVKHMHRIPVLVGGSGTLSITAFSATSTMRRSEFFVEYRGAELRLFENGELVTVSDVDTELNIRDQFTITISSSDRSVGDFATFIVDDYLGNIAVDDDLIVNAPIVNGTLDPTYFDIAYGGGSV